jgi:hypothetical protein
MTEISPLDEPTPDGLDNAFMLPEFIMENEPLVTLYEEMVKRLRQEAKGLPMNTLQQLLIERISSFYVQIKHKENTSTFTMNQQKEFNVYWLSLTQEFNRLLAASDDKLRSALLIEVQTIVSEAVSEVKDPEDRRTVRRVLADKFANIGL